MVLYRLMIFADPRSLGYKSSRSQTYKLIQLSVGLAGNLDVQLVIELTCSES